MLRSHAQILQEKLSDDNINTQSDGSIAIKSVNEKKSTVKPQRCINHTVTSYILN